MAISPHLSPTYPSAPLQSWVKYVGIWFSTVESGIAFLLDCRVWL